MFQPCLRNQNQSIDIFGWLTVDIHDGERMEHVPISNVAMYIVLSLHLLNLLHDGQKVAKLGCHMSAPEETVPDDLNTS